MNSPDSRSRGRSAREVASDVLVVGGSLGAVAATLAAADRGVSVTLVCDDEWLGGQLTTQAAPPDEHRWIERSGAPASYRRLRRQMRMLFRGWYPLSTEARSDRYLNPGRSWVSRAAAEPWLWAQAIEGLMRPAVSAGNVRILRGATPVGADVTGDHIDAVTFQDAAGRWAGTGRTVLDATEEGDLLALAGVEHVTGFESSDDSAEPSAPRIAQPENHQAITYAFAVDHRDGEDHRIDRPVDYERWRALRPDGWPGPLIDWTFQDPRTRVPVSLPFAPNPPDRARIRAHAGDDPSDRDLWRYRRVFARSVVTLRDTSDVTIINWPMNDYFEAPITGAPEDRRTRRIGEARSLSLSLLYWLQTDAPRPDGGVGWPGLRLRGDVLGTSDGLARSPYIRESRRLRAEVTVCEQDIARAVRGRHGAVRYPDSVGVGSYRIDLHPSTGGDLYLDVETCPFEVPLGSLIPRRVENLVASAKNIGTTHISNGCYRVHPVEWTIGEAAGALAAFCAVRRVTPRAVRATEGLLAEYLADLVRGGAQLHWPDGVQ